MNNSITPAQLKKIMTLWRHWWKLHGDADDDERAARLRYFSSSMKRPIASTKELSRDEAEQAIKGIAAVLPEHLNFKKKRLSRRAGQELSQAGRRNKTVSIAEQIVGPIEMKHITNLLDQLGWNMARLEGFLHSPSSPLGGRSVIRTVDDAFKVRYALKGVLSRKLKAIGEVAIR
jgi:hypothetical protein